MEALRSSNSGLPDNAVHTITIDGSGNMWIGTGSGFNGFWKNLGGLAVFKEGGVILSSGEAQKAGSPETIGLLQNYPNPFNSTTTIKYTVTEPGFVSIKVFNTMGTEVASLVYERKPKGDYSIGWNTTGLTEGIYFCRLQAGTFSETKKLVLQK